MPDPSRALLLVAHMDVVGVDKSKWTVDPFAATIKDGYMYGRGSIDDKGMLAANLAAFIALKRSNARVNRDVIFLATADEEQGGDASIRVLIAKYWDKFAAGFALNEGGRVILKNGKVEYVAVQASEKVPVDVAVIREVPRASSVPTRTTLLFTWLRLLKKLALIQRPYISPPLCAAISNSSRRSKTMNLPSGFARSIHQIAASTLNTSSPTLILSGIPCCATLSPPPCSAPVCVPT